MHQLVLIIVFSGLAVLTWFYIRYLKPQDEGIIAREVERVQEREKAKEQKKESDKTKRIDEFIDIAAKAVKKNDIKIAKATYKKIIALDEDNSLSLQALGVIALKEGDVNSGIALLERAHKVDPLDASVLANLGLAHFSKKNYEKAEEYFEHSLAIDPDVPKRYYNLALLYKEQNKNKKYLHALKKLVALDAQPEYYELLGAQLFEDGSLKAAKKAYEKLLELDRKSAVAKRELLRIEDMLSKK